MTCDYCIYGAKGAISKVVAGGKDWQPCGNDNERLFCKSKYLFLREVFANAKIVKKIDSEPYK